MRIPNRPDENDCEGSRKAGEGRSGGPDTRKVKATLVKKGLESQVPWELNYFSVRYLTNK